MLRIIKFDYEKSNIQINTKILNDKKINGYKGEYIQTVIAILHNSKDAFILNGIKDRRIDICIDNMLTIEDNAGGIDDKLIDRIFEPYFTTKYKNKGTGTGLYMAKMIIENSMNGTLSVEQKKRWNKIQNYNLNGDKMSKNYSILYAEDNKDVRENYVLYLENYFDYIYEANDGLEAFDIYRDKKPNVLLLDINMPNMNGLELAKKIRENDSNIPIVILSAHSDKEFLFEAIKLNLVEYLTKPVDRNKFKSVLENSIKKVKENAPNNQFIHFAKTTYWDCSKRLFFHKNKMIDLTRNERILFELLLNNKNEIINPNENFKVCMGQ